MPRSLVHLLLSLLLLVTQQLALLHATAHAAEGWHPTAGAAALVAPGAALEAQPAPALPELCALCVDGAQVASALPAPAHAFVAPALAHDRPAVPPAAAVVPPAAPAFQPRGPPVTS